MRGLFLLPFLSVFLTTGELNAADHARPEQAAQGTVESRTGSVRLWGVLRFLRWPGEPPQGVFLVGIAGSDPDEAVVRESLEGRLLLGRPVQFRPVNSIGEMKRCQLLFVGRTAAGRLHELLPQLEGSGVLTVSAIPGFGQMGGMVELTGTGQPVIGKGIVVNAGAAYRSGFLFNAGLLAVVSVARTQGFSE